MSCLYTQQASRVETEAYSSPHRGTGSSSIASITKRQRTRKRVDARRQRKANTRLWSQQDVDSLSAQSMDAVASASFLPLLPCSLLALLPRRMSRGARCEPWREVLGVSWWEQCGCVLFQPCLHVAHVLHVLLVCLVLTCLAYMSCLAIRLRPLSRLCLTLARVRVQVLREDACNGARGARSSTSSRRRRYLVL
jgi:hypothetical protein